MSTVHTTTVYTTVPAPVYAAPPRHEEKILHQAPPPQENERSHGPHPWETSLFNCSTSYKSCPSSPPPPLISSSPPMDACEVDGPVADNGCAQAAWLSGVPV